MTIPIALMFTSALFVFPAGAGEFAWLPLEATGSHTINGNQIILVGGDQVVTLELYMFDWDPDQNNDPLLGVYQATVDSTGYSSGGGDPLVPVGWPETPEDGTYITTTHPDYVFAGITSVPAVFTGTLDYEFGSTGFGGAPDDGAAYYGGTLLIHVPTGARGTYTIGFVDNASKTFMRESGGPAILPIIGNPASITVVCGTGADCDDGNECTDDICDDGVCSNPNSSAGTRCGNPPSDLCDAQDTCDGMGNCVDRVRSSGEVCRPANGSCDVVEQCDGVSVECPPDEFEPDETPCPDDGNDCTNDWCGSGACVHPPRPEGTDCGSPDDTECTDPDTCDANGVCQSNDEPPGTACGDPTDGDCTDPDTCDGAGSCQNNHEDDGTDCTSDSDDCTDDVCASGACTHPDNGLCGGCCLGEGIICVDRVVGSICTSAGGEFKGTGTFCLGDNNCNGIDDLCEEPSGFRREITIHAGQVCGASPLVNFPVLVDFTDEGLSGKAQPDGDDFMFTDAVGIRLSHEIERYDHANGHLIAWVNVPSLSGSQDTILYLCYGDPTAGNQEDVPGTWNAGYAIVQHLREETGNHYDSSSNGNDGVPDVVNQAAVGKIGGADEFQAAVPPSGPGSYVDCGNNACLDMVDTVTVSAWIKPTAETSWSHITTKGDADVRPYALNIFDDYTVRLTINKDYDNEAVSTASVPIDAWSYVAGTYDAGATVDNVKVYLDGQPQGVANKTVPMDYTAAALTIGARVGGETSAYTFDGTIDEVRVSSVARSADWICTEHNNQAAPQVFLAVGEEEAICQPPLVESVGSRYFAITPQPELGSVPMGFVVTSPDWDCLNKYIGGFAECGATGIPCFTDADCNECSGPRSGRSCLTDEDCKTCDDGDREPCQTDEDCGPEVSCIMEQSCIISGDTCGPVDALPLVDINDDGLADGPVATLVDNPEDALFMTPEEWGTRLYQRCSISFEPCTLDEECDVGRCDLSGKACSVAAQDCKDYCTESDWDCVSDEDCTAGPTDTCTVTQTCTPYETCLAGRIYVTGVDILPSEATYTTTYEVAADCGAITPPTAVVMRRWGDADQNDAVNFADIQLGVLAFLHDFNLDIPPRTTLSVDLVGVTPCLPDRVVNFTDILQAVLAFKGATYNPEVLDTSEECDVPCP